MKMKNKELELLFQRIEAMGWSIEEEEENRYRLSKYSPQGQDFSFSVKGETTDQLIENIYNVYDDFDVSEETYLWLDNTGHGVNGAPYHMRDVLEDMEACEQMILDLWRALK